MENFLDWNKQYELGKVDSSTHPGTCGINKRWDELQTLLEYGGITQGDRNNEIRKASYPQR